jgi:hypothetical protein
MVAEIVIVPETVPPFAGETMVAVVACAKEAVSRTIEKLSATKSRVHENGRDASSLASMNSPYLSY